jgi:hypothetical protein
MKTILLFFGHHPSCFKTTVFQKLVLFLSSREQNGGSWGRVALKLQTMPLICSNKVMLYFSIILCVDIYSGSSHHNLCIICDDWNLNKCNKRLASINVGNLLTGRVTASSVGTVLVRRVTYARSVTALKSCIFCDVHFQELTELHHDNVVALLDCKVWPSNINIYIYYIRLTDKCYVICNKIFTVSFLFFQETSHNVFLVMEVSHILSLCEIIIFFVFCDQSMISKINLLEMVSWLYVSTL